MPHAVLPTVPSPLAEEETDLCPASLLSAGPAGTTGVWLDQDLAWWLLSLYIFHKLYCLPKDFLIILWKRFSLFHSLDIYLGYQVYRVNFFLL